MQNVEADCCAHCSVPLSDTGDELVCPSCGEVREKTVVEVGLSPRPSVFGRPHLGSYMGSKWATMKERSSVGVSGSQTGYLHMKAVSDFAGRDDGPEVECAKMIERVAEKLGIPRFVTLQAAAIARKVVANPPPRRRLNVAEVSAYSLVAASRVEGVLSASVREILRAHAMLGRRVTTSAIIQLSLESPVKTYARGPEDYVTRVVGRLSLNQGLSRRLRQEGVPQTAYFVDLRTLALELLRATDRVSMEGKRPCALAAAAVYSAEVCLSLLERRKRRVTQKELADCGDTSEYTIREQCASLFAHPLAKIRGSAKLVLTPRS
ncbi:MAG: hypothetical protein JRN21_05700 [Nitrososphaerota archaeon]|nr:hypothetical protein [Nitrososphaerota archaeon]